LPHDGKRKKAVVQHNLSRTKTAALKNQSRRFSDTAAKGGCPVSFSIPRPFELSKKARLL
jgi:hypothetical protein